ncbi:MAG: hypothetical protein P9M14_12660 [Candidatus Alcyoniella australis]|nr:hypothetical protein [Candidatus Alcyoniella australis]
MLGKLFDAVVIGTEISGLIAGALLVKRGYNVLVVDVASDKVELHKEGYLLRRAKPFFFGFGQGHVFSDIFNELGIPFLEKKKFVLAEPAFQLILPQSRLDFPPGREAQFQLLEHNLGTDAKGLRTFFTEIDRYHDLVSTIFASDVVYPPASTSDRWKFNRATRPIAAALKENEKTSFDEFVSSFNLSTVSQKIVRSILYYLSSLQCENVTLLRAAYLLGSTHRGLVTAEGGIALLESLLKERISSYRGKFHQADQIEEVVIRKGKLSAIRFPGEKDEVRCRHLLVSSNPKTFFPTLLPRAYRRQFRELCEWEQLIQTEFTLYVGIDDDVVPVGMHDNLILIHDPERELWAHNLLFLNLSPRENEFYAPKGKRLLQATCRLNFREDFGLNDAKQLSERIVEVLRGLIPFLDEHIDRIFVEESFKLYKRRLDVDLLARIEPIDTLGLGHLTNRTPQKEVLYAGRAVLPGMEMEGEAISAITAADIFSKSLMKKR